LSLPAGRSDAGMRRFAVLAASTVFLLAGCGGRDLASAPRSIKDDGYRFGQPPARGVLPEVVELPAPPPIEPGEHRPRRCGPPGPRFGPIALVSMDDVEERVVTVEPELLARFDNDPSPTSPLPPARAPAIWSWQIEPGKGVKEPLGRPAVGLMDPDPQPWVSVYRADPSLPGAYRSDEYHYCDDAANRR
jgi:hypothetical protein